MSSYRGLDSETASFIKKRGHAVEREFANLIGLDEEYLNDRRAKKDVIDKAGDAHSVKGGEIKWQIFLYSANRFENDYSFKVMNGMGQLLANCIYAFPEKYEEYIENKAKYKKNLEQYMIALREKLEDKDRRKNFFYKSIFNAGEVNYLTIKHEDKFHMFYNKDVIETFGEKLTVENSIARNDKQFNNQKVVFKLDGKNFAEIEMRNDSKLHYREVRFNMLKVPAIELLRKEIQPVEKFNDRLLLYGKAIKNFEKCRHK